MEQITITFDISLEDYKKLMQITMDSNEITKMCLTPEQLAKVYVIRAIKNYEKGIFDPKKYIV